MSQFPWDPGSTHAVMPPLQWFSPRGHRLAFSLLNRHIRWRHEELGVWFLHLVCGGNWTWCGCFGFFWIWQGRASRESQAHHEFYGSNQAHSYQGTTGTTKESQRRRSPRPIYPSYSHSSPLWVGTLGICTI